MVNKYSLVDVDENLEPIVGKHLPVSPYLEEQRRVIEKALTGAGKRVEFEYDRDMKDPAEVSVDGDLIRVRINPSLADRDSAYHEYGHVFVSIIGTDSKEFQELLSELKKNQKQWNRVQKTYSDADSVTREIELVVWGLSKGANKGKLSYYLKRFVRAIASRLGISLFSADVLGKEMLSAKRVSGTVKVRGKWNQRNLDMNRDELSALRNGDKFRDIVLDRIMNIHKYLSSIGDRKGWTSHSELLKNSINDALTKLNDNLDVEAWIKMQMLQSHLITNVGKRLDTIRGEIANGLVKTKDDLNKKFMELSFIISIVDMFNDLNEIETPSDADLDRKEQRIFAQMKTEAHGNAQNVSSMKLDAIELYKTIVRTSLSETSRNKEVFDYAAYERLRFRNEYSKRFEMNREKMAELRGLEKDQSKLLAEGKELDPKLKKRLEVLLLRKSKAESIRLSPEEQAEFDELSKKLENKEIRDLFDLKGIDFFTAKMYAPQTSPVALIALMVKQRDKAEMEASNEARDMTFEWEKLVQEIEDAGMTLDQFLDGDQHGNKTKLLTEMDDSYKKDVSRLRSKQRAFEMSGNKWKTGSRVYTDDYRKTIVEIDKILKESTKNKLDQSAVDAIDDFLGKLDPNLEPILRKGNARWILAEIEEGIRFIYESNPNPEEMSQEDKDSLEELFKKRRSLSSSFYEDGRVKTGDELEMSGKFKDYFKWYYKATEMKRRTKKIPTDGEPIEVDAYDNALEYAETVDKQHPGYLNNWYARNTETKITKDFWDELSTAFDMVISGKTDVENSMEVSRMIDDLDKATKKIDGVEMKLFDMKNFANLDPWFPEGALGTSFISERGTLPKWTPKELELGLNSDEDIKGKKVTAARVARAIFKQLSQKFMDENGELKGDEVFFKRSGGSEQERILFWQLRELGLVMMRDRNRDEEFQEDYEADPESAGTSLTKQEVQWNRRLFEHINRVVDMNAPNQALGRQLAIFQQEFDELPEHEKNSLKRTAAANQSDEPWR